MRGWGPLLSWAKTDGGSYDSLCDSIIDGGSGEFLLIIDGASYDSLCDSLCDGWRCKSCSGGQRSATHTYPAAAQSAPLAQSTTSTNPAPRQAPGASADPWGCGCW